MQYIIMTEEILKALFDWNPWMQGSYPQELCGFTRDYLLDDFLQLPEIKILEGARRVGKSTLFYQIIKKLLQKHQEVLYINFEDEVLKKYPLSEILSAFRQKGKIENLFIDEIQNCIDWAPCLRKIYDRKEISQIWISGSNSSLIKQEFSTLLTGRNIAINIYPLSFKEFLLFKSFNIEPVAKLSRQGKSKILNQIEEERQRLSVPDDDACPKGQARRQGFNLVQKGDFTCRESFATGSMDKALSSQNEALLKRYFLEYIEMGSFPAIALRNVLQKELLINYFEDFLYRDIASRHDVNITKLKELAIYLATNSSKCFSYRNSGATLNLHPKTVMDYCSYLYEIFLFRELHKFDCSLKHQMRGEKKIYIADTGLGRAISFRFSQDQGRVLENVVFNELHRRKKEIYFHKQKYECDFLIKRELEIIEAIQVTQSLIDPDVEKREIRGLLEAMHEHHLQKGLILTLEEEKSIEHEGKKIQILPIWKWLYNSA